MDHLQEWIRGINLGGKRKWLQPSSKSSVVVAGVVVEGKVDWVEANTKTGTVTVPARLHGDPRKFKEAQRQFVILAEKQLEAFVNETRKGRPYGLR